MKILARETGLLFFRVGNTRLNEHNYIMLKNLQEDMKMLNSWYNVEEEIKEHDGERDEVIKRTEAQETGRYDEWD